MANIMRKQLLKFLCIITASVSLAACSGNDDHASSGIQDPFEGYNRAVYAFNTAVDDAYVHPLVDTYRVVVPSPARTGIRNFLRNLKSPVIFANQLLQGDFDGAGDVLVRAAVNSTVGVGGLFDVAGHEGIEYESEDFGQTLAVWGVGHGPYFMVPFMGGASLRDGTGFVVDGFADPLRWYARNIDEEGWFYGKAAMDYLDLRESLVDVLRDIRSSSIDSYAAVRSTYYQRREALVQDLDKQTAAPAQALETEDGLGWDDF